MKLTYKYKCSKCNDITYCSNVCQKLDWKNHKVSCIEQDKSAYELERLVYKDDFQYLNGKVSVDYGLYQSLIKILRCDINKFHEYYLQNKLPELIIQEFFIYKSSPNHCGEYFKGLLIIWKY